MIRNIKMQGEVVCDNCERWYTVHYTAAPEDVSFETVISLYTQAEIDDGWEMVVRGSKWAVLCPQCKDSADGFVKIPTVHIDKE